MQGDGLTTGSSGRCAGDHRLNPGPRIENLDLVADPHRNFVVIMKDGKIYKNTIK